MSSPPLLPDRTDIDTARVRQLFGMHRFQKIQASGSEPDFIVREVSRRMAERLDYIKLDPRRALDAGCGSGADWPALQARFPAAQWQALDFALQRLLDARQVQRASLGFFDRLGLGLGTSKSKGMPHGLCADMAALPIAPRALDFIWSNLALHWHNAPHRVLPEWARVLNVGGLVLFSAFGPDTLREVSRAFAAIDACPHVLPFTDMHDYGDMLVASGFATPVVDSERLTLTYTDPATLWRDVRALGGNALRLRRRGLLGRVAAARLAQALDLQRNGAGQYTLTFEIVYGHAWKGQPKTSADGRAIVQLHRPGKTPAKRPPGAGSA